MKLFVIAISSTLSIFLLSGSELAIYGSVVTPHPPRRFRLCSAPIRELQAGVTNICISWCFLFVRDRDIQSGLCAEQILFTFSVEEYNPDTCPSSDPRISALFLKAFQLFRKLTHQLFHPYPYIFPCVQ